MDCAAHPGTTTSRFCAQCGKPFCDRCLVTFLGRDLCGSCKQSALRDVQHGQSGSAVENAGFGPRFFAMFIDIIVVAIPTRAIQVPLMVSVAGRAPHVAPGTLAGVAIAPFGWGVLLLSWLIGLAIQSTYFTWMIGARGQTLGKMALRLKVVREDLSKVSYARAFGRFWGYQLSSLVLFIGYLMVIFSKDRKALHDFLCDTRVIKV